MPLTLSQLSAGYQWHLSKANVGGKPATQEDSLGFAAQPDVGTVMDQLQRVRLTFTANGTQTVPVRGFANGAGEQGVNLSLALLLIVLPVGCSVVVKPGATSGLSGWFLPAAGLAVGDGGIEYHYDRLGGVVDATHFNIDVTATMTGGVTSATVDVAIAGKT